MKNQLLLAVFVIGLTSCTSASTPDIAPTFTHTPTETFSPTAFSTSIPTDTATPTKISTIATATTEPIPHTSFGTLIVSGISSTGDYINSNNNLDLLFHTFTVQPNEIISFRFGMEIKDFRFIKNELTSTPTAIPIEKWRILIYRYETDGTYINQPGLETNFITDVIPFADGLRIPMAADVSMEVIQTKFGDCSAFTYQVMDEQGIVQQQGYFSINPHILFHEGGGLIGSWKDGVTLGFPYSLNEKEIEFFHQGKFVAINESPNGFYLLVYIFDFGFATGIHSPSEIEAAMDSYTIKLFPYRDDGNYSNINSHPLISRLLAVGGLLTVELPIDYMRENNDRNGKYYLQITDSKGIVVRDEYFIFIPYNP